MDIPIYFAEGNHDPSSCSKKIKNTLRSVEITVLENEISVWREFQIIGLNHNLNPKKPCNMYANNSQAIIKDVFRRLNIKKELPSILLRHSPSGIKYANEQGIDLFLAGHTHAGQIFPVNYIGGLIFP